MFGLYVYQRFVQYIVKSEKGIVNSEKFATATWYDLNGRKVAAPTKKGIYIMNGKKVVVK